MNFRGFVSLLTGIAIMVTPLSVSASPSSELIYALRNTLTHDFTVSGTGKMSVLLNNRSLVSGDFQYRAMQNDGDLHSNDNYNFRFDTGALTGVGDEQLPVFAGRLAFGSESLYRAVDEKAWGRVNNLMLDITEADQPQIEKIAEGGVEMLKFFTDRYISLDMQKLSEILVGDSPEIEMLREQFAAIREGYADYGNFTADALAGIMSTNIFDIRRDNGAYVITLTEKPQGIALENLAPMLIALGMPSLDQESLKADLQAMNAQVEQAWPMIREVVDFKIRVTTDQSRISVFTVTLAADDAAQAGLPQNGSLQMSMSGVVEDRASRIAFPTEPGIDFTKIIEAFVAFSAQANSMMNSEAIEVEVSEDDSMPPPPPVPAPPLIDAEKVSS